MTNWKKIRDSLMKDFGWKLLSLLIAISLWFIVINIKNPSETRNFTVEVNVKNTDVITDNNQVISNLDEILGSKITIKIRAQRLSLDRLYQLRNEIEAYIDVSDIDWVPANGEIVELKLNIKPPSNFGDSYEIETARTIQLVIENTKSIEMPVVLSIEEWPSSSYSMSDPEINPSTVIVSGTENEVNTVVGVKAVINVENISEDQTYNVPLIPYDANGLEVLGVRLSQENAEIYVPIKSSKKVPIVVETVGTPAGGYALESIASTPEFVYLLGDDDELKDVNEIILPAVNINGRSTDLETSYVLKYVIPDGVKIKTGEPERVVVRAKFVAEEVKDVMLKESNITLNVDLDDNLSAEVMLSDIPLQIKGLAETLEGISDDDITAVLDVSKLQAGEHVLPLMVTVPEGVSLTEAESPYVTVVITEIKDENTNSENEEQN